MNRFAPAMVLALALVTPDRADACQAACLSPGWASFSPDGSLPANIPGVFVRSVYGPDLAPRLLQSDGGEVAGLVIDHPPHVYLQSEASFLPSADLTPGERYRIEFRASCGFNHDAGSRIEQSFTATDAVPPPTSLGTVSFANPPVGEIRTSTGAACSTGLRAASAVLSFTPSAELIPFLPSTEVSLFVDGNLWGHDLFGLINPDGTAKDDYVYNVYGIRRPGRVFTACGPGRYSYQDLGLSPGPHKAILEAHVANGPTLRSPEIDFILDCGPSPEDGGIDAGVAQNGGDAQDGGTTSQDAGAAEPRPTAPGCGCTQTGAGALWAVSALAAALLARRRSK